MKANNGKGNNSSRDEWRTPKELIRLLKREYTFMFDCCANPKNRISNSYSQDFESVQNVRGLGWMNPPFSNSYKMFKHFFKVVHHGIAIYRFDNAESKIWQDIIFKNTDWVFVPSSRIRYEGEEGNSPRFPSALIGLNTPPPKKLKGTLLLLGGLE